jgi:hypothetical protein
VGDVNLAENSALPSDMNNAVREVMSHLKAFASGTDAIDALTVTGAATVNGAFTSPGIDDNADATAITIDSSENLLVGRTDTSSTTAGTVIYGGSTKGAITQTFAGRPLYINRLTTDGDIIEFAKDSTTVGSIGVNTDRLFIGDSSFGGIAFPSGGSGVLPAGGSGALNDNTHDLGNSSTRFKDLYLSGTAYVDTAVEIHAGLPLKLQNVAGNGFATIQNAGAGTNTDLSFNTAGSERLRIESGGDIRVATAGRIVNEGGIFLGGTASANLLDDYEEGDWTPTGNGQTLTNNFAKYRKIGSLVAIQAYIVFPTNSDTSGNANIAGLPFAGTQPSNAYGAFTVGYSDKGSSFTILKGNTTTDMDLRLHDGNNVKNADMSGKTLIFAGVYISV